MAEYLDLPITTDTASLTDEAFAYLEDAIPGWQPAPANLDTLVIEACARIATESRFVAAQVPLAIFRHYGANIAGLDAQAAAYADGVTTWTAVDTAGHVIPAGTELAVRAGEEWLGFATTAEATITAPADTVAGVPIRATAPGSRYNGQVGSAELATALAGIAGVEITTPTSGGSDDEPDADYIAALVELLRLAAPRPILAADFAALALREAGVERATALDDTDPATAPTPADRSVTVGVTDADGEALSAPAMAAVQAALEAQREANFQVFVVDPDYTAVDVAVTVAKRPGYADADVQDAVEAALTEYLNPAVWGQEAQGQWTNVTKVRLYEAAGVAARAVGVQHVTAITIEGSAADYTLAGLVPLPRAGTITVTIA